MKAVNKFLKPLGLSLPKELSRINFFSSHLSLQMMSSEIKRHFWQAAALQEEKPCSQRCSGWPGCPSPIPPPRQHPWGCRKLSTPLAPPDTFPASPHHGQSPTGSDGCWLRRSTESLPATSYVAAKPPSQNLHFQETKTQSSNFYLPANRDPGTPLAPKPSL